MGAAADDGRGDELLDLGEYGKQLAGPPMDGFKMVSHHWRSLVDPEIARKVDGMGAEALHELMANLVACTIRERAES